MKKLSVFFYLARRKLLEMSESVTNAVRNAIVTCIVHHRANVRSYLGYNLFIYLLRHLLTY